MPTEEEYRKVADLVAHLNEMTDRDDVKWKDMGPLGFFETTHQGVKYLLDNPQDGKPSLSIDDICVWEGYELWDLRDALQRQDRRLHPLPPPPGPPAPDPRIPDAVDRALKTFKKK